MFFIGIFGANGKVVPSGPLPPLACPVCGRQVSMHLCHGYQYIHLFFVPIIKYADTYPVTCPSCASVFELPQEKGRAFMRGRDPFVSPSDLRLIRAHYRP